MTDYEEGLEIIAKAIGKRGQCGFHIVIDDGNVETSHIEWCYENRHKNCSTVEDIIMNEAIYEFLICMSEEERYDAHERALEIFWYRKEITAND